MIRRTPWLRELVAVGRPVVLYGGMVGLGLLVFSLSVLLTQDTLDEKDVGVLSVIWVSTLVGVLAGQIASVTRLRSGLFLPCLAVLFVVSAYLLAAYEQPMEALLGEFATLAIVFGTMLASIMASGGFWSLRVNRGLAAAWAPMVLFSGAILIYTEHEAQVDAWHQGLKHEVWTAVTFGALGLAVVAQLLFMAARERHRLHRWRTEPEAAELVTERPDPFRPFAGVGTLFLLGVLVLALTVSSALVAPYLWRTGDETREGSGHGDGSGEEEWESEAGSGGGLQKVGQYMRQGVQMGCALFTLLVLAVAALIVFGLPLRRQLLLAHLRDPMWPVPPSRRARLHWRLAEIALGDAGVHRKPGDSARDVAARAIEAFPMVNLEALASASEIADRVMYGYALDAGDADTIRRAAEMTYQAVWDTLSEAERLKATYRLL